MLRRWTDPFEEMRSMIEEMDRIMNEIWAIEPITTGRRALARGFRPAVEVTEDADNVYVRAAVPGVPKDSLEITVENDRVFIKGEVKEQRKEEKEGIVFSEMRYGAFERVIPLPSEVKAEDAKAAYKDGVLELTIPKKVHEAKGVRIKLD
ncbi:Hsp20/alpha crystallin family protein [Coprothermobacteraceae bacterium]|nr:Hsp20/alpha crystallin family protein [Coprothermobacteraceae bacterium]